MNQKLVNRELDWFEKSKVHAPNSIKPNESLGKFEGEVGTHLKSFINDLNTKKSALEKEVENNNRIVDLVLVQIKALFESSLAKIKFLPEIITSQKNIGLVTRDVLFPSNLAGAGEALLHP